jgi:uncharacterized protein YecE (DUF72 family)
MPASSRSSARGRPSCPSSSSSSTPPGRTTRRSRPCAETGTTLCVTERAEDAEPPAIRRTGPFLYLRLRRHDYDAGSLAAWADRLEPFLAAGDDAYVFFRHDEVGRGAELALEFDRLVAERAT